MRLERKVVWCLNGMITTFWHERGKSRGNELLCRSGATRPIQKGEVDYLEFRGALESQKSQKLKLEIKLKVGTPICIVW